MIGASAALRGAVQTSKTLRTRCDVIVHDQVIDQLDVVFDGSVQVDNTAARLRTLKMSVADPNGTLAQAGLIPFQMRLRPYWGARIQHTTIIGKRRNDAASWAGGTHVGTTGAGGTLTMV